MNPNFFRDLTCVDGSINFQIVDLNDRFARTAMQVQENRVDVGIASQNILSVISQLVAQ